MFNSYKKIINMPQKDNRLIIFIVIAAVLIIGGIILGVSLGKGENKSVDAGILLAQEKSFDFGTVSMAQGKVSHSFEIKNGGKNNLILNNINTSCMCTTAVLEKNGQTSPEFGMAGMSHNPVFWSEELAPGETANLIVTFDPAAHGPAGVGLVDRVVSVYSNDPAGRTDFRITANVTP